MYVLCFFPKTGQASCRCHDPLPVGETLAVKEFTNLQPDFAMVDTTYEEESKYLTFFFLS